MNLVTSRRFTWLARAIDSARRTPRLRPHMSSYPEFLIDKRVIERNIQKGIVDSKEYAKGLERLPDVADNAAISQPAEDDEDDMDKFEEAEDEAAAAASDDGDDGDDGESKDEEEDEDEDEDDEDEDDEEEA
jgi:hypothetical protein